MSDRSEAEEDRAAELGYRTAGARELAMRDWLSLQGERGEVAASPRDFKRLVWRLQQRKYWKAKPADRKRRIQEYRRQWALAHAEAVRKSAIKCKRRRRRLKTPGFIREMAARKAKRKAEQFQRRASTVFACVVCGAEWCIAPPRELPKGQKPKYCSQPCRSRANWLRSKAAGKTWAKAKAATRRRRAITADAAPSPAPPDRSDRSRS